MKINEAIKAVKEGGKKNFTQTVDMIITLKNIDLKKPENKFSKDIVLPHGRSKDVNVGIISDKIPNSIGKNDLENMGKDKKLASSTLKKYEFLLCEAPLMPVVGKTIGKYLAPKGRMPKLIPPDADHEKLLSDMKKSVRIGVRNSLCIQTVVGSEESTEQIIEENMKTVYENVKTSLPKGTNQIKNVMIKKTMGKPVKVDM